MMTYKVQVLRISSMNNNAVKTIYCQLNYTSLNLYQTLTYLIVCRVEYGTRYDIGIAVQYCRFD